MQDTDSIRVAHIVPLQFLGEQLLTNACTAVVVESAMEPRSPGSPGISIPVVLDCFPHGCRSRSFDFEDYEQGLVATAADRPGDRGVQGFLVTRAFSCSTRRRFSGLEACSLAFAIALPA